MAAYVPCESASCMRCCERVLRDARRLAAALGFVVAATTSATVGKRNRVTTIVAYESLKAHRKFPCLRRLHHFFDILSVEVGVRTIHGHFRYSRNYYETIIKTKMYVLF